MSFKDVMKDDVKNVLLNTDEFAEEITYVTKAGVELTINAVVERGRLEDAGAGGAQTFGREIEILVLNDSDDGITAIDVTGDYVMVSTHVGEDAVRHKVIEILDHDESSWSLRCAK